MSTVSLAVDRVAETRRMSVEAHAHGGFPTERRRGRRKLVADHEGGVHTALGTGIHPGCPLCVEWAAQQCSSRS